jgi:transposase
MSATEYVIGIDLHKSDSQVAVMDEEGQLIEEMHVENADLGERVGQPFAGGRAVIEATGNYFVAYDALDDYLDVTVANPWKTNAIGTTEPKTDRVDAKLLADLHRADLIEPSYVPSEEIRQRRALTRGRKDLVDERTTFENKVQSLLNQHGIEYRSHGLFSEKGRTFLEEVDLDGVARTLLDVWLDTIDGLTERIERLDAQITERAAELEETQIAMDAPGVAAFSSMVITAELGDVSRFAGQKAVVSYAGLAPSVRQSGDTQTEGSITKQGSSYLRWVLFECAQTAVHVSEDPYLSEFYWRLRNQRGKSHKEALVATSRKLLVSLYHMLTRKEGYNPPGVDT